MAEEAVLHMVELLGADYYQVDCRPGERIVVTERRSGGEERERVLKIELGNIMDITNLNIADVVMLETDIPMVGPSCRGSLGWVVWEGSTRSHMTHVESEALLRDARSL